MFVFPTALDMALKKDFPGPAYRHEKNKKKFRFDNEHMTKKETKLLLICKLLKPDLPLSNHCNFCFCTQSDTQMHTIY